MSSVQTQVAGPLGIVTLTRPEKINALTPGMVQDIAAALRAWRYAAEVKAVVLRGEGERGFCAGGDLAGFHEALREGEHEDFLDILAAEFELAAEIDSYPKTVVAIMHGLTLGAGLGLAGAASVRVVTPEARVGMPETRIGYSPDVGGSLLLARAPGLLGDHLAATGDTLAAGDAIEAGLADFCVEPGRIDELLSQLEDLADLTPAEVSMGLEVLLASPPPRTSYPLRDARGWIDECYAQQELPEVLAALESSPWPAARAAAERIRANSPTAVVTALEAVRAARDEDELRGTLEREHRAASLLMQRPDLAEGIRARIIDRDDAPAWDPADPADVDADEIRASLDAEDERW